MIFKAKESTTESGKQSLRAGSSVNTFVTHERSAGLTDQQTHNITWHTPTSMIMLLIWIKPATMRVNNKQYESTTPEDNALKEGSTVTYDAWYPQLVEYTGILWKAATDRASRRSLACRLTNQTTDRASRRSLACRLTNQTTDRASRRSLACRLTNQTAQEDGMNDWITARDGKARWDFNIPMPYGISNTHSNRDRHRLFNRNINSVLLYGSESWWVDVNTGRKLQTFVTTRLRSMLRVRQPKTTKTRTRCR